MKRLALAGLVVVAVGVVAGSALGSNGNNPSVIYDSTPAAHPGNIPSIGAEAYGFHTLGDKITFGSGPRKLTSVVVTMSSWACQYGSWEQNTCNSRPHATFSQPITLTIWNASHTAQLASDTKTFDVPYRPSVSPECAATDRPGGWYQPSTQKCFNGLASDVTFGFSGLKLPSTVVYEISYDTRDFGPSPLGLSGPYDSLNVGLSTGPAVGSDVDPTTVWTNGSAGPLYDATYATPSVQFNATRVSRVN